MNDNEKKLLLKVARNAIESRLGIAAESDFSNNDDLAGVSGRNGAFVTLHRNGLLRGCIGNFVADKPLYELVREMAVSAAFSDPRFPPVSADELKEIDVEISVLSPLVPCKHVEDIRVGRDGIYIVNGFNRGVLLPQVAIEYGWDRETFLDQTCVKAGMRQGCWNDPATEIFIFSAEIFGEKP